ncbi:hypothetical protein ERX46_01175 [Brumimicrobium glaciale]|jgi:hypothetical protein|uniref:Lipoprotein n=1 Tax=Brumimicrobium glaciale TaxID=200475 RepID=A0A4V1WG66_9FLAO|nr:hypothetical protein [Brumimicrobium glaciale]RYM35631.1 hypothetical protein ERX46_01175 [Brumimicrobium glaciale]
MKILIALLTVVILGSCATKVPYTTKIKAEFELTPDKLKKVQFYTSEIIILERSDKESKIATTGQSGELVTSERSTSERIVIPANRPCVFEQMEDDGTVQIRFELGDGRVLRFAERQNISNGRFYLVAQWANGKGELDYGGSVYYAVRQSASAYLMVKLKNWKKNQRKDRVVKGMKI